MDERSRNIARLILKYYQNELDLSEKEELESWLNEDKRNRETLQHYNKFPEVVNDIRFFEHIDGRKGWEQTSRKIVLLQNKKKKMTRWILAGSVAASLILLFSLILLKRVPDQQAEHPMITLVAPDRTGVQLELSSGELVSLAKISEVKEDDGIRVAFNDTIGIVYQNVQKTEDAPEELIYNTMITPRGTEYLLTLSDGSRVWLNSDSRLRFPVRFGKGIRRVELIGEGYFEVRKDSTSPFIVSSGEMEIKVTGTSFNIMAYPGESTIQTTLVSGSVQVKCPKNPDIEQVNLAPNQIAIFNTISRQLESKMVDITPYIAWHEGYICFRDEELGTITKKLERWYDLTFEFDAPDTKKLIFYGSVKRHANISQVLDMLKCTNLIDFKILDSKTIRVIRL